MKKTAWILVFTLLLTLFTACGSKQSSSISGKFDTPENLIVTFKDAYFNHDFKQLKQCLHPNMADAWLYDYDLEEDSEYWSKEANTKITNFQILSVTDDVIIYPDLVDYDTFEEKDYLNYVYSDQYEEFGVTFTESKTIKLGIRAYNYTNYEEEYTTPSFSAFFTDGRWYLGYNQ